jgi:hypothetical protein
MYNCFYKGNRYKGEFHQNKRHGYGVFEFNNGDVYKGEFKDGEMHGEGKLIKQNKAFEGTWNMGKFVVSQDHHEEHKESVHINASNVSNKEELQNKFHRDKDTKDTRKEKELKHENDAGNMPVAA